MPEFFLDIGDDYPRWNKLPAFVQGYIEAAAFCGCEPPDGHPMKDVDHIQFSFGALYHATVRQMAKDCTTFCERHRDMLDRANAEGRDDAGLGRDFWYTRNGHGTGFWDREELNQDLRDNLCRAADLWCEVDLYMTEHGRVG